MADHPLKQLIDRHKATVAAQDGQKAVEEVYAAVEKLVEDVGQNLAYKQAQTDYLREKIRELQSIRQTRNCVLLLGCALSVAVLVLFYYVLFLYASDAPGLAGLPEMAKVAFISASFIASFGLIAIIIKGIFKSSESEEQTASLTEDSARALLQLLGSK